MHVVFFLIKQTFLSFSYYKDMEIQQIRENTANQKI